jgi:hypothetical protein
MGTTMFGGAGATRAGSALLAVVLAAVAYSAQAHAALPTLYVTYDASCNFTVTRDDGSPVGSSVPYGTYQVEITTPFSFAAGGASCDFAQFQLTGPGVSLSTNMTEGDAAQEYWTETFLAGSIYRAIDNNHPGSGQTTFSTSNTAVTPVATGTGSLPPASSRSGSSSGGSKTSAIGTSIGAAATLRGTLIATVSAAGKLTLTDSGKEVGSLTSGRYTIEVKDSSKKSGFVLQEINRLATALSTASFTGTRKVSLTLKPGQWFFFPTFIGKKTYFIVVA